MISAVWSFPFYFAALSQISKALLYNKLPWLTSVIHSTYLSWGHLSAIIGDALDNIAAIANNKNLFISIIKINYIYSK